VISHFKEATIQRDLVFFREYLKRIYSLKTKHSVFLKKFFLIAVFIIDNLQLNFIKKRKLKVEKYDIRSTPPKNFPFKSSSKEKIVPQHQIIQILSCWNIPVCRIVDSAQSSPTFSSHTFYYISLQAALAIET